MGSSALRENRREPCCATCGILAFDDKDTGELEEVGIDCRTSPTFHPFQMRTPRCALNIYDLPKELGKLWKYQKRGMSVQLTNPDEIYDWFHAPRNRCTDTWERWIPTHSPREHIDMQFLRDIERKNSEWREGLVEKITEITAQMDRSTKQARRHHVWNYILSGLAILASLVAALIAARVIPLPWLDYPAP